MMAYLQWQCIIYLKSSLGAQWESTFPDKDVLPTAKCIAVILIQYNL